MSKVNQRREKISSERAEKQDVSEHINLQPKYNRIVDRKPFVLWSSFCAPKRDPLSLSTLPERQKRYVIFVLQQQLQLRTFNQQSRESTIK
jgi:hypothetical protein